jgi:hypothetical protein
MRSCAAGGGDLVGTPGATGCQMLAHPVRHARLDARPAHDEHRAIRSEGNSASSRAAELTLAGGLCLGSNDDDRDFRAVTRSAVATSRSCLATTTVAELKFCRSLAACAPSPVCYWHGPRSVAIMPVSARQCARNARYLLVKDQLRAWTSLLGQDDLHAEAAPERTACVRPAAADRQGALSRSRLASGNLNGDS